MVWRGGGLAITELHDLLQQQNNFVLQPVFVIPGGERYCR